MVKICPAAVSGGQGGGGSQQVSCFVSRAPRSHGRVSSRRKTGAAYFREAPPSTRWGMDEKGRKERFAGGEEAELGPLPSPGETGPAETGPG